MSFNPCKCTHTWSSGQPTLRRPGSSCGFGALLKGLTSIVDNSSRSRDSNQQPQITSPTLYPLGHDCPATYSKLCTFSSQKEYILLGYSISRQTGILCTIQVFCAHIKLLYCAYCMHNREIEYVILPFFLLPHFCRHLSGNDVYFCGSGGCKVGTDSCHCSLL